MTLLFPLLIALALCLLLLYVRAEQRRRRRELGLSELTPDIRDLRRADLDRIRDLDEALALDAPAWTDIRYHNLKGDRMKLGATALAVLTSLILAAPALAHHPVGSASQVCNEDGTITLTATFENDFEGSTEVTATDSGGLVLPSGTSPYTGSANAPGPDRAGGTVTFEWSADDGDSGSLEASYEAVSDCEGPPVAPPPDNPSPPQKPPADQTFPGGPNHSPPPSQSNPPPRDTLPFSGAPVAPMALFGFGLLGAGLALRRLHRG